MIILSCLKKDFIKYVDDKTISNKVYDAYKSTFNQKTKLNQIKSWANSLPFLKNILEVLPENTGITIEYKIPLTSKRIDVIISGYDIKYNPIVILLELKGWQHASLVPNEDAIVTTLIGKSEKKTLHPSYQVLSYSEILKNYNTAITNYEIEIIPLVYLHNYNLEISDDLYAKKYHPYYSKAPMYGKNNVEDLKYLIENKICFGDNLKVINMIEKGEIKPTKNMLDVLYNMLLSKKEFTLLDEQKTIMENINKEVLDSYKTNTKEVIIIKGGPGTGKSILALNALGSLLSLGLIGAYVSKNMAPRKVYKEAISNTTWTNIFKSSSTFFKEEPNKYDFLLIDEAQRLQEKSGLHNNIGENQIKEIINSARCTIFFVDELQMVTLKDIGSISNIKYYAKEHNAKIFEFELTSQFRCNGSDNYLNFIEHILYNKRGKVKFNFDFQVINSPKELHELIKTKNTNNNARLVAGFCWRRNAKEADNQNYHDIVIDDFSLSWNLKHGEEFATRKNAINEVGCIYNVQGLDFDYIGVIIGPDLIYKDNLVQTNYKARANTEKSLYGLQILLKKDQAYYQDLADKIIRNTYRVLLTRGLKGCYVYACDPKLQAYLKKISKTNVLI